MVTNMNVPKCAGAASAYQECTNYAIKQLDLPNVAMYLDAGHAGWLGWPANQGPAATMYAKVWKDAGKPKSLRGLATNVSNYNGWLLSSAPSYTTPNPVYDESKFVHALGPLLANEGWDAKFIVDQGRSGKQPTGQTLTEWGEWCNQVGTGFGMRPTANTGDALVDAFVWIKPGGECDGTSDTTAARYDHHCVSIILPPTTNARPILTRMGPLGFGLFPQAGSRGWSLVPGLLRAIASQRQPFFPVRGFRKLAHESDLHMITSERVVAVVVVQKGGTPQVLVTVTSSLASSIRYEFAQALKSPYLEFVENGLRKPKSSITRCNQC
jgi:hypothetical protein